MAFTFDKKTNKITCPRGNNGAFNIDINGIELGEGDVVEFYVRDPAMPGRLISIVQQITDGECVISLDSAVTSLLPPGRYKWNLRIITAPEYGDGDELITAEGSANSITVWNIAPDFVVLEV